MQFCLTALQRSLADNTTILLPVPLLSDCDYLLIQAFSQTLQMYSWMLFAPVSPYQHFALWQCRFQPRAGAGTLCILSMAL